MVWAHLLGAIAICAIIAIGACVALDLSTYRSLQRCLLEERKRKLEEPQTSRARR
jgi:hypothetical protein